jgi:hypothetical protein
MWRRRRRSFFTISKEEDEEGGVGLVSESSRARRALQCRMLPAPSCAQLHDFQCLQVAFHQDREHSTS